MCGGILSRKTARESIVRFIFQLTINDEYENYDLEKYYLNNEVKEVDKEFIEESVSSIIENMDMIDNNIKSNLKGWEFNRLYNIDKAILRIATNEILFNDEIPSEVSINEAVELAKEYSSEDAYKFVNGVLGAIAKKSIKDE